jgi:hypothetical protein
MLLLMLDLLAGCFESIVVIDAQCCVIGGDRREEAVGLRLLCFEKVPAAVVNARAQSAPSRVKYFTRAL